VSRRRTAPKRTLEVAEESERSILMRLVAQLAILTMLLAQWGGA
jgi:hypothetical protein